MDQLTPIEAACKPFECEQCRQSFAPREGTGGKPQRFCSPECRTAFHSENRQRDQRAPTCSAIGEAPATPIAETPAAIVEASDDFDWFKDPSIVLEEQPAVAVYLNNREHVIIRQKADWSRDEDTFIYVAPHNLMTLIDALCDIAGVPELGKRQ